MKGTSRRFFSISRPTRTSWTTLGRDPAHAEVIEQMYAKLHGWTRRVAQRTTRTEEQLVELRKTLRRRGVVLGVYDENDVPLELTVAYRDRKAPDRRG